MARAARRSLASDLLFAGSLKAAENPPGDSMGISLRCIRLESRLAVPALHVLRLRRLWRLDTQPALVGFRDHLLAAARWQAENRPIRAFLIGTEERVHERGRALHRTRSLFAHVL